MSVDLVEFLEKIIVPIITAVIGLFSGIQIERKKNKNTVTINGSGNSVSQGNSIDIKQEVKK